MQHTPKVAALYAERPRRGANAADAPAWTDAESVVFTLVFGLRCVHHASIVAQLFLPVKPLVQENLQFAAKLRSMMGVRHISAYRLAKLVGVSHTAVGYWLKGLALPGSSELKRISQALGVPMGWFFGEEPPPGGVGADQLGLREEPPIWGQSKVVLDRQEFEAAVIALQQASMQLREACDRLEKLLKKGPRKR